MPYKDEKKKHKYLRTHQTQIKAWNRESSAVYRITHSKKVLTAHRAYNKEHQREIAEYQRTHKETRLIYRNTHRSENRTYDATRRALEIGVIIGATATQLKEIKGIYHLAREAPKVRCYLCGKLIPKGHRHVDHVMPLSKGGAHRPSNLAVACDKCNLKKSAKMPEEVGILL